MAKRNARKQATRAELEEGDVVCRELALLMDRAELLILTQGADYDTDDELSAEYDKRLTYLPVLLSELVEHRVLILYREENKPQSADTQPSPEDPTAHEGSSDAQGNDATETE